MKKKEKAQKKNEEKAQAEEAAAKEWDGEWYDGAKEPQQSWEDDQPEENVTPKRARQ